MTVPPPSYVPTLGGKYQLETRLGGGGMAEVFRAAVIGVEGFARRVAVKRVLPGYSDSPTFAQMFVSEAKISSRLQHPNIVSVLDFDRDAENRLFLVMELVEGKDLDGLVSTGQLPVSLVIYIIAETLRGLGYAHDLPVIDDSVVMGSNTVRAMKGLIHRDISPHNVLLSWEGIVKVSDFGIAKARNASNATGSEIIKGKPAYMSPEQANGEQLDGRSDLFAVGIMMWEMLCGRRLFIGDDTRTLLAAVLFRPIPRPRSVRSNLPKDVERVVMRLLERELPARYATAEQALSDLLACQAAPRDGRAELKRVMAERFASEAPVRHSAVKQPPAVIRTSPNAATVYQVASPVVPTVLATPRALRSRAKLWWLAVPVALAAIVVIALATTTRPASPLAGASPPIADASVAVTLVDASVTVVHATVVDAAPPPSPSIDAAPPIDAAVVVDVATSTAAVVDAATSTAVADHPTAAKQYGRLKVSAFPALTIYVDKKKLHDTPVDTKLPVGWHTIRLVNSDVGHDEVKRVLIRDNQTTTLERE